MIYFFSDMLGIQKSNQSLKRRETSSPAVKQHRERIEDICLKKDQKTRSIQFFVYIPGSIEKIFASKNHVSVSE